MPASRCRCSFTSGSPPGSLGPLIGAGQTLAPGVYNATTSLDVGRALALNAHGDPDAARIFQVGFTLVTRSASSVRLAGCAQACPGVLTRERLVAGGWAPTCGLARVLNKAREADCRSRVTRQQSDQAACGGPGVLCAQGLTQFSHHACSVLVACAAARTSWPQDGRIAAAAIARPMQTMTPPDRAAPMVPARRSGPRPGGPRSRLRPDRVLAPAGQGAGRSPVLARWSATTRRFLFTAWDERRSARRPGSRLSCTAPSRCRLAAAVEAGTGR
jgi:hypothetical protein